MTEAEGPAFERIARAIRDDVTSGVLAPGDRAPSEAELRERFGVSKSTVARAVSLLKAWGVVETQVGSGTRVVDPAHGVPVSGPDEHTDRLRRGQPIYAPGERSELYAAGVVPSDQVSVEVLQALGLPSPSDTLILETTTVVKRARVMYRGDRVAGVCTTWFNHPLLVQHPGGDALVERLTAAEKVPQGTSRLVSELVGHDFTHSTTRVGLRMVPDDVAQQLAARAGEPFLWALTTRYADDYPLEVDEWFRWDDVILG